MSAYFDSYFLQRKSYKRIISFKKDQGNVDLRGCLERKKPLIDVDEASQIIMSRYLFGFLIPFQCVVFFSIIC